MAYDKFNCVRGEVVRRIPKPFGGNRYRPVESADLMQAGVGFILKRLLRPGEVAGADFNEFMEEMAVSSRRIGVEFSKATSRHEADRAEFYHAIPKILEARAFELGLIP